jgi:hypothetical protein
MHLSNVYIVLCAVRSEAWCAAVGHAQKAAEWCSACTGTNGQLFAPRTPQYKCYCRMGGLQSLSEKRD